MNRHLIKILNKKIDIEFCMMHDGTMELIRLVADADNVASYANAKAICIDVFEMFDFDTYPSDDNKLVYFEDLSYPHSPHVNDILKRLKQVYGENNVEMTKAPL